MVARISGLPANDYRNHSVNAEVPVRIPSAVCIGLLVCVRLSGDAAQRLGGSSI